MFKNTKKLLTKIKNFFYGIKECPAVYYQLISAHNSIIYIRCSCNKCKMYFHKITDRRGLGKKFRIVHGDWIIDFKKDINKEFTKVLNKDLVGVVLQYF